MVDGVKIRRGTCGAATCGKLLAAQEARAAYLNTVAAGQDMAHAGPCVRSCT